jgi:hypothetical protein
MSNDETNSSDEKVVVAYFFTIGKKSIPFAFLSMAIDRYRTRMFTGISFAKLLGCGTGETFTPSDADLYRWGTLVVIDESRLDAFDNSSIIRAWRKRSTDEFRVVMSPISTHGLWSGEDPFSPAQAPTNRDAQIVAITRARLKFKDAFTFWRSVPPVVAELHSSPGLIAAIGIGEAPIGLQGTFSLWESGAALRDFAYKGAAHQKVIADTHRINWYAEELFARFEVLEIRGSIADKQGL